MRKLDMDPGARLDLFVTMEALLGYIKSLHTNLGEVMADVAAIRDAVVADPTEIAAYRNNLNITLGSTKPLVEEAMRHCDDMLEEFVASRRWEN
jgi:hypothetical protein